MTLTQQEMLGIKLPAWSPMLVKGDRVSPSQAAEVLIRTDNLYFATKDRAWERTLNQEIGITQDVWDGSYEERIQALEARDRARIRYRVLSDIQYLNNRKVASSSVRGPYGWINWDGTIFCDSYMIGKHAKVEEVFEEWLTIAKEWPFLRLRCQLLDTSIGSPLPQCLIEYVVESGCVSVKHPREFLLPYVKPSGEDAVSALLRIKNQSERGCTLDQFRLGLKMADRSSVQSLVD